MAIPESQLATWSAQGAVKTSASTRQAIYGALYSGLIVHPSQYEVYLHGSYANDTNIYSESDVDIVVQFNAAHLDDFSKVPPQHSAFYNRGFSSPTYQWNDFRSQAIGALQRRFGATNVTTRRKCIKVAGNGTNRRPADVVVAIQYRDYQTNLSFQSPFVEGIAFYSQPDGRAIVNYPKQHLDNGVAKMAATSNRYKSTVRVFKNMRNRMINDGYVSADLAPSYFLQCLLFNSPNNLFARRFSDTVPDVINWLTNLDGGSLATLRCQNEQQWLFGESEEQWDVGRAVRFMTQAARYWNDWT